MHRAVVTAFRRPRLVPQDLTPHPSGGGHVTRRLAVECATSHRDQNRAHAYKSLISFYITKLSRLFPTSCLTRPTTDPRIIIAVFTQKYSTMTSALRRLLCRMSNRDDIIGQVLIIITMIRLNRYYF